MFSDLENFHFSMDSYAECRDNHDLVIIKPYKTAYIHGLTRGFNEYSVQFMDI